MDTKTLRGAALVLAAAMLWGTTGTAQSLSPSPLPGPWTGALRLLVAALFFVPVAVHRRRALSGAATGADADTKTPPPPKPGRLPWAGIALAAACMAAYNLAFFAGVRACGVAVGTAIALGSGPVWAGALQALVTRRWPAPAWWAGTGLAVGGVTLMSLGGGGAAGLPLAGAAACLAAGLSYAVYALVNQRMVAGADPAQVTAAAFTLAAVMALPAAALISGVPALQAGHLPVLLWLGVVSTGVAYLLFSQALRLVSAATGVVLALAEPVTAFVLAVAVVGEHPGAAGVAGLAAVLAGLGLVVRSEMRAGG